MLRAQIPSELNDILESIRAVKGPVYMQLVMHSANMTQVMRTIEDIHLRTVVALATAPMMADIADLANIDVKSPAERKEYEANVRMAMQILEKIKPTH